MVLALHIWGPAFGLASIDPECLAAVELLRHALPLGDWNLKTSNDGALDSHHTLPALEDDRGRYISGYTGIVDYLRHSKNLNIDDDLTPIQQADASAYATYLYTRGAALTSLALYVSHSAWVGVTRPAYSQLLPFPLTWTIPPTFRAAAIERVDHLGLGHLASTVDDLDEQSLSSGSGSGATTTATGFMQLPARFGPSKTLQPEQSAAIRLQSLADDFFTVVQSYRADGDFFAGRDRPSSVDFLTFAYLKFMRISTPQPFLRNAMLKSHPQLWQFSEPLHIQSSSPSSPNDTISDNDLPWQDSPAHTPITLLAKFTDTALAHVPSLGQFYTCFRSGGGPEATSNSQLLYSLGFATASLAAAGLAVLFKGMAPLGAATHTFSAPPREEEKTGFNRFGNDLGSMLSALPDFGPTGRVFPEREYQRRDTVYQGDDVEVKVDVEPVPPAGSSPIVRN